MELDFVHELIDQIDAAPVIRVEVLTVPRVGDFRGIETRSWIAHDNQHATILIASHVAFNYFGRIALGAVNNRVRQGFRERQLDVVFPTRRALHFAHHVHHTADHGIDRGAVSGKSRTQLEIELAGVKITRLLGRWGIGHKRLVGLLAASPISRMQKDAERFYGLNSSDANFIWTADNHFPVTFAGYFCEF